ncbi:MAG: FAD-dependent oxidoreductase [Planctomycetota bacterium]
MAKIAILGAGISGLSLARFLLQGGVDPADLTVFEAGPEAGGLCRSKTVQGFTYDISGGHILFSKDQAAMDWMKSEAGGDPAFEKRDRHTKIRFEDRWVHYPFENGIGDLPKQANFDCLAGYVKAWHARQTDGSSAPETFGKWVQWRFGDGIAKHFMDPYNEKIWKRDLDFLTSDWVAGRVPDAPIEDVLRAAVGIRTEGYTHQSIFYYPRKGGFQAITDGMASGARACLRLNTKVEEVRKTASGVTVNGEAFDLCVSTLPLTYAPGFFPEMPESVAHAMRTLEYNGLVSILVALDRPDHPELSWIYLPHPSQGPANRVTYMSNYATANAPAGKTSLMAEVTVPGGQPFPGPELEQQVVDGFVQAGLMRREELLFTDRSTVNHAYVVFDAQYEARRKVAFDWLDQTGVIPLGRFGRFEYDNSDQIVIKSRKLAGELLAKLSLH